MSRRNKDEHISGSKQVSSSFKNAGKIIGIVFLCVAVLVAVFIGVVIYKGISPAKSFSANSDGEAYSDLTESEHINVPVYNELKLYAAKSSEIPISLSDEKYMSISELIKEQHTDFNMGKYYALDQAMELYRSTPFNKGTETTLLTNGKLDAEKLIEVVKRNNSVVMPDNKNSLDAFLKKLDDADIALLCKEIAKVINNASDEFDIRQTANTLENLTMFKREGSTSNAYISTDLTFVYNPIMTEGYSTMQELTGGSSEKAWEMVIDHEVFHLIQYGASDGNADNGIEIGICRLYNASDDKKTVPVDSLYYPWLLEAGAEMMMSDYLGVKPGIYEKKISYVTSYNLSRFYESCSSETSLERVGFKHTPEEAFTALGLKSESEQLDFLKFMFSVEITQSDPEDFWEYYKLQTGETPSDDEKLTIRMGIRNDAEKYLTENFFLNFINAVHESTVNDLDTAFYLLRVWELDTFNHLNYSLESVLEYEKDFVLWYNRMQSAILSAIAESSGLDSERIETMYSEYCLQTEAGEKDNCDLSCLSDYTQAYISATKNSYRSSNFSRIYDVAKWLDAQAA